MDSVRTHRRRRVLIVDGNPSVHAELRKLLADEDHSPSTTNWPGPPVPDLPHEPSATRTTFLVESAYRGKQALEAVRQAAADGKPFWLALVDAESNEDLDGVETIARLAQFDPEMVVVLCTDYPELCWQRVGALLADTSRLLVMRKPLGPIEARQLIISLCEKWELSRIDPLTGLLNRRAFFEHFQREWARTERHGPPLCCAMVDLDFFKKVNDSLGHTAGDQLLCQLAAVLKRQCRATDFVCRYGGEEFCVLMPDTHEAGAVNWANRTRQAVAQLRIPQSHFRFTASIGVAQRMDDMPSPEQLVDRADQAMLVAKHVGRDRVIAYSVISDDGNWNLQRQGEDPFADVTARDIMTKPISCLHQDESMEQAGWFLLQSRISSTPVVDDTGRLAGILSEKDLVSNMASQRDWQKPVRHVMQPNVVCYEETSPLREIYDFLCRVSIRRVIVVRNRRPTGVISRGTLLRWFNNRLRAVRGCRAVQPGAEPAGRDRRAMLLTVARCLVEEAQRLQNELEASEASELAIVLSATSQIQGLLGDLVVFSPVGPELEHESPDDANSSSSSHFDSKADASRPPTQAPPPRRTAETDVPGPPSPNPPLLPPGPADSPSTRALSGQDSAASPSPLDHGGMV